MWVFQAKQAGIDIWGVAGILGMERFFAMRRYGQIIEAPRELYAFNEDVPLRRPALAKSEEQV